MERMGLQIGKNTGVNLNKLIQKKPQELSNNIDNFSQAPFTPMPTKRDQHTRQQKPIKKNEGDESNDKIEAVELDSKLAFKTPLIQPKNIKNVKVHRVIELFGRNHEDSIDLIK